MGTYRRCLPLALALVSVFGPEPASAQSVEFSPNPVTFVPQAVGSPRSSFKHVHIKNTGTLPLVVTSAMVSGADFSFSGGGTTQNIGTIDPGATFSTLLVFTASATGPRTGTLTLLDNAPGSPHTLSISSQGFTGAGIQSPSQDDGISLITPTLGTGTFTTETILSSGNQSVTVTGVSISASGFFQLNSCGAAMNPGQTCDVQVTFSPTVAGPVSGTLSISNTGFVNPLVIPLSGDGADFSIVLAPGSTSTATITAGQVAQYHLDLTSPSGLPGATGGIAVTCSGLPPASTCNVTQTTDSEGFFTTVSIGIVTTGPRAVSAPTLPRLQWPVAVGLAVAMVLGAAKSRSRRQRASLLSLLLVFSSFAFLISCGGGSSSPGGTVTPPGSYPVTISATRGNLTRTFTLTVNVQ